MLILSKDTRWIWKSQDLVAGACWIKKMAAPTVKRLYCWHAEKKIFHWVGRDSLVNNYLQAQKTQTQMVCKTFQYTIHIVSICTSENPHYHPTTLSSIFFQGGGFSTPKIPTIRKPRSCDHRPCVLRWSVNRGGSVPADPQLINNN